MRWREELEEYLAELGAQGRRPHTLRGYRSDLSGLLDHLQRTGHRVDQPGVASYLASIEPQAPATRARKRASLRGFLRWAEERGLSVDSPDRELRSPVALPTPVWSSPLSADVEAALAQIPRQADTDQLLFRLLARLGLRPGEALALRAEDFDRQDASLDVPGWGGIRRRVLVDDPDVLMRLINWPLSGRTGGPLFCARGRPTPLRYQSAVERWRRYTRAAGVSLALGDLRRAHIAELVAGGVPEQVIRDRIGQRTGPLLAAAHDSAGADDAIRAWRADRDRGREPARPSARGRPRRASG